jgi:hypothetical protein
MRRDTERQRWWPVGATVGLLLTGCSAADHVTAVTTPPASSPAASRPGGLIGVIDTARLTAVCADARQAQTVLSGGVADAATGSLVAAATLLERPPVDPSAAAAGATIRAELRRGNPDAALAAALAFCRAHGG